MFRVDFISNSSSCSFVIHGDDLNRAKNEFGGTTFTNLAELRNNAIILRDSIKKSINEYVEKLKITLELSYSYKELGGEIVGSIKYQLEDLNEYIKEIENLSNTIEGLNDMYITGMVDRDYHNDSCYGSWMYD